MNVVEGAFLGIDVVADAGSVDVFDPFDGLEVHVAFGFEHPRSLVVNGLVGRYDHVPLADFDRAFSAADAARALLGC